VRPDLFGRAVLQEEYDSPMYCYGFVDVSLREITWRDVKFSRLANIRFEPVHECPAQSGLQEKP
jgi:hypothetical protein